MTREARHLRCPENVLGWIPWYFDGSLTDRQRGAVEAHASECADCRADLDLIAGGPFEIDVELPDPDRAFAQIMARIEEHAHEPSAQIRPIASRGDRPGRDRADDLARIEAWALADSAADEHGHELSPTHPHPEAGGSLIRGPWMSSPIWAAAAALVLVSLGAVAGAMLSTSTGPSRSVDAYELASADVAPAGSGGAMIDVVFRESVTASEIASVLRSLDAEIVSGPTNLGVYRVRLASESPDAQGDGAPSALDIEAALSRLKAPADGIAVFAEVVR